ncbi:MAG: hypothetical protein ACK4SM_05655 [Aquificaceae bacterium]
MKALLVSFDKTLVKRIKEALKEYEVVDVKNGEEAINTVPPHIDIVIYDAISGSISEEDINNMYQKKFKDAKYIILVDELFPVDMANIKVEKKIKLMRDEAVHKIKQAITEGSNVAEELPPLESFQFETTYQEERPPSMTKGIKVLLVSFDNNLIDKIKMALGDEYDLTIAKNAKEAMEKAKDASVIIYDTISGMIAQKALSDMATKEEISEKPYVVLLDDLFAIDVDKIPLRNKYSFSREAELARAVEKIKELSKKPPLSEAPIIETPTFEPVAEYKAEEASGEVLELLGELLKEKEEKEVKEEPPPEFELTVQETKEIPTEQRLPVEEFSFELKSLMEKKVTDSIKEALSQKLIEDALLGSLKSMPILQTVEKTIKEEISRQLSLIDINSIIREEASKILNERLRELIT